MRFSIAITARSILWGQHMVIAQNAAASIFSAALATVTVSYITDFGSTATSPTSAPTPTVPFSEPIAICDYVFEGINQEAAVADVAQLHLLMIHHRGLAPAPVSRQTSTTTFSTSTSQTTTSMK